MTRPNQIFKYSWEIRSDILFLVTEGNSLQLRNNLFTLSRNVEIGTKGMTTIYFTNHQKQQLLNFYGSIFKLFD